MYDKAYDQSDSADLESEGRVMSNVINMGGSGANLQEKTVSAAQTEQSVTPPSGVDGFSKVTVKAAPLQTKGVVPSYTQQRVTADAAYYGLEAVVVGALTGEKANRQESLYPETMMYIKVPNTAGLTNVTGVAMQHNDPTTLTSLKTISLMYVPAASTGVEIAWDGTNATVQYRNAPTISFGSDYIAISFTGVTLDTGNTYKVIVTGT